MRTLFPEAAQQEFLSEAQRHSCGEVEECDEALASAEALIETLTNVRGRDLAVALDAEERCRQELQKQEAHLQAAQEQVAACDAARNNADTAAAESSAQLDVATRLLNERTAELSVAERDVAGAESEVDVASKIELSLQAAADDAHAQLQIAQTELEAAQLRKDEAIRQLDAAKAAHAQANAAAQCAIAAATSQEHVFDEATRTQISEVAAANADVDAACDQLARTTLETNAHEHTWQIHADAAAQSALDAAAALASLQREEAALTAAHTAMLLAEANARAAAAAVANSQLHLDHANVELAAAQHENTAVRALSTQIDTVSADIRALEAQQQGDMAAIALHNSRTTALNGWISQAENTISSMQRDYDNCRTHLFALGDEAAMTAQQVYFHGRHQMNAVRNYQQTWRQSSENHANQSRELQRQVDQRNTLLQQLKAHHAGLQREHTHREPVAKQRLTAAIAAQRTASHHHQRNVAFKASADQRLETAIASHTNVQQRQEQARASHREAAKRHNENTLHECASRAAFSSAKQQLKRAEHSFTSAQNTRDTVVVRNMAIVAQASSQLRSAQAELRASEYERDLRYKNVEASQQVLQASTDAHRNKRHLFECAQTLLDNAKREYQEAGQRLAEMESKLFTARNNLDQAQSALSDASDVHTANAVSLAHNKRELERARSVLKTATADVKNASTLFKQRTRERDIAEENERDIAAQLVDAHRSIEVVRERRRVTEEMIAARPQQTLPQSNFLLSSPQLKKQEKRDN
ncbi:Hypothetical protein, putative [Bodo saltans]|uniref:Uncharacterized protein n=1 Tax=Bodo saltans TaxID=75058 RepID=A0A0S4ILF9_BODSA|nr:Hypothetical protein, putative [Bodo saltans]|eukprot:CUE70223.1 Hypothetical protein, putative [Bodo saltans]